MDIVFQTPIAPGTRHVFQLAWAALRTTEVIDYVAGANTLLHISLRPCVGSIVLNDRRGGSWRQQVELRLEQPPLNEMLQISVLFGPFCATVTVGCQPPVEFSRGVDVGEAERIVLPERVHFTAIVPPVPAAPLLRLEPDPEGGATRGESSSGGIRFADIQHVAGWLEIGEARATALIVALPDGDELCRYVLPAPEMAGRTSFTATFPADPRVRDGMELHLVLEVAGERKFLDRGTCATTVIGGIDRVTPRMVGGWAWNARLEQGSVPVEILVNGEVVGTAIANRGRRDLREIDRALGAAGFLCWLPDGSTDRGETDVRIEARVQGTGIMLANGPWPISRRVVLSGES
ncbi:hypothetical protein [Muricoccus pecuniae]|uniref:Uncharacterized protein n=1 Tax=Muricoccus pecuniae TaxID=693023 RepID=A0A840XX21_9PROT|nr:hypothetical protein [Roseomonas pecuniae]MBB5693045.1 hypothetical protein [Roseomonas pecuniae]